MYDQLYTGSISGTVASARTAAFGLPGMEHLRQLYR
jgi:hypothetical protein